MSENTNVDTDMAATIANLELRLGRVIIAQYGMMDLMAPEYANIWRRTAREVGKIYDEVIRPILKDERSRDGLDGLLLQRFGIRSETLSQETDLSWRAQYDCDVVPTTEAPKDAWYNGLGDHLAGLLRDRIPQVYSDPQLVGDFFHRFRKSHPDLYARVLGVLVDQLELAIAGGNLLPRYDPDGQYRPLHKQVVEKRGY